MMIPEQRQDSAMPEPYGESGSAVRQRNCLAGRMEWGVSMLVGLHVKNLALIEKAEVEFDSGLNILTGETGAGKSILIGSVALALGAKASKDMIRQGAESAAVELMFTVDEEEKRRALEAMELAPDEDGLLLVSRKITPSRSISRINDETVTAKRLQAVTSLLLDIHGQHEHQSLLHKQKHLDILDAYSRQETGELRLQTAAAYREYRRLKERLSKFSLDEESRRREADFTRFEVEEIERAAIKPGEEETLAAVHRRISHGRKIAECLAVAARAAENEEIGRALREVESVASYDEGLSDIVGGLRDAESILADLSRSIASYIDGLEFDEEELRSIEDRLDLIRGLMAKYGPTEERILASLEEKKKRLEELEHYEELAAEAKKEAEAQEKKLLSLCGRLSAARSLAAAGLKERIRAELVDLNFLQVEFEIAVRRLDTVTSAGYDEVEFLISTNPGAAPPLPLGEVASGGELSRIMLAIKTVLADTDEIPTLIFDEIDTGISGRTAQRVSERLAYIAGKHQVLCITHLPQIAAMADTHFEIRKEIEAGKTITRIRRLSEDEQIEELARLLGGAEITDRVRENAREMKRFAGEYREKRRIGR